MPKGEAPEQSIVQRIGAVRGPDKDDVVAESVKLLHQGNRHTVHFRNIVLAAAPCPDSVNLIEAERARRVLHILSMTAFSLSRMRNRSSRKALESSATKSPCNILQRT